jgi:thiosulfate/3-mercaptopyruvate sulfurtransferase
LDKIYPYPKKGSVRWVSTDWLEYHLNDSNLIVLDIQPNVHDYITEHISGAVYMNEGLFRVPYKGRPAVYVPEESIKSVFSRLGLGPNDPVVVYTGKGAFKVWGDGLEQTMAAYTLARFGHKNIHILNGGLDKWKKENRKLSKVFPKIQETDFEVNPQRQYWLDYQEFKSIKDNEDVILLDARPPNVYEGQGPWIKPGHIPGAVNLPWSSLMADYNKTLLKSDEEIQSILKNLKITKDKTIICSCGTGREATNEFVLFKWYLGYPNVKIYEGSFTEWTSYPENPTVTGKKPREIEVSS